MVPPPRLGHHGVEHVAMGMGLSVGQPAMPQSIVEEHRRAGWHCCGHDLWRYTRSLQLGQAAASVVRAEGELGRTDVSIDVSDRQKHLADMGARQGSSYGWATD